MMTRAGAFAPDLTCPILALEGQDPEPRELFHDIDPVGHHENEHSEQERNQ